VDRFAEFGRNLSISQRRLVTDLFLLSLHVDQPTRTRSFAESDSKGGISWCHLELRLVWFSLGNLGFGLQELSWELIFENWVNFLGFWGLWDWSGRDGSGSGRRSGENCFEGDHIDPLLVCEGRSAGPRLVVVFPTAGVHRLGGFMTHFFFRRELQAMFFGLGLIVNEVVNQVLTLLPSTIRLTRAHLPPKTNEH
jgi:hypothetical protein